MGVGRSCLLLANTVLPTVDDKRCFCCFDIVVAVAVAVVVGTYLSLVDCVCPVADRASCPHSRSSRQMSCEILQCICFVLNKI